MERFVRQLTLAALFFGGSWLWAIESPSSAAELQMPGGAHAYALAWQRACCPNCSGVEYRVCTTQHLPL